MEPRGRLNCPFVSSGRGVHRVGQPYCTTNADRNLFRKEYALESQNLRQPRVTISDAGKNWLKSPVASHPTREKTWAEGVDVCERRKVSEVCHDCETGCVCDRRKRVADGGGCQGLGSTRPTEAVTAGRIESSPITGA